MKKLSFLLIFLIAGISSSAQSIQKRMYVRDNQNMVLILNNEIIGGLELLKSIPSNHIQEVNVNKEKKLSSTKNLFFNNDKGGIMLAKTDYTIKTKSQEDLNSFFGLDPGTDVYVNGFLLENKKYRIASESIIKIEIIARDHQFIEKHVLNISIE